MPENLFIQVVDGKPVNHPATEENLRMFIDNFDPENPPATFEKFVRRQPEEAPKWKVVDRLPYAKVNGVWTDVFGIRDMMPQEKQEYVAALRRGFQFADTWSWDDDKGEWVPPVPYPTDGKFYLWANRQMRWILAPLTEEEMK